MPTHTESRRGLPRGKFAQTVQFLSLFFNPEATEICFVGAGFYPRPFFVPTTVSSKP